MGRNKNIYALCVTDCVYGFQLARVHSTLERGLESYAHQKTGQVGRRKGVVLSESYKDGLPLCVIRSADDSNYLIISLHRVAIDQGESLLGI